MTERRIPASQLYQEELERVHNYADNHGKWKTAVARMIGKPTVGAYTVVKSNLARAWRALGGGGGVESGQVVNVPDLDDPVVSYMVTDSEHCCVSLAETLDLSDEDEETIEEEDDEIMAPTDRVTATARAIRNAPPQSAYENFWTLVRWCFIYNVIAICMPLACLTFSRSLMTTGYI